MFYFTCNHGLTLLSSGAAGIQHSKWEMGVKGSPKAGSSRPICAILKSDVCSQGNQLLHLLWDRPTGEATGSALHIFVLERAALWVDYFVISVYRT